MIDWTDIALPFVKQVEVCKLRAYPDPATGGEPWMVGVLGGLTALLTTLYHIGVIR